MAKPKKRFVTKFRGDPRHGFEFANGYTGRRHDENYQFFAQGHTGQVTAVPLGMGNQPPQVDTHYQNGMSSMLWGNPGQQHNQQHEHFENVPNKVK